MCRQASFGAQKLHACNVLVNVHGGQRRDARNALEDRSAARARRRCRCRLFGGLASSADARLAAGTGPTAAPTATGATADPYKVGIVYWWMLAAYGAQYIQGLRLGSAYATKGTNAVNGRKIERRSQIPTAPIPVKAVSAAINLLHPRPVTVAVAAAAPLTERRETLVAHLRLVEQEHVTGAIDELTYSSERRSILWNCALSRGRCAGSATTSSAGHATIRLALAKF